MTRPIPKHLKDEFVGYMQAGYEDDDAPDGAWFARMENDAFTFMAEHRLKGDENDAVHQLLDWMQPSEREASTPKPACDRCHDIGWWTPPNGIAEPCCEKPTGS